jgi:hypothetical protein
MATPSEDIQGVCDRIVRTATITETVCDGLAASLIAEEQRLGDSVYYERGYDTALSAIDTVGQAIGGIEAQ